MKQHNIIAFEAPDSNVIKEGQIYIHFDSTGLIDKLQKRIGGKMVSLIKPEIVKVEVPIKKNTKKNNNGEDSIKPLIDEIINKNTEE